MKTITENLTTPILGEYDIIIVGGGPAGCGTALAAARAGAKVIIVEQTTALGGMWAGGFMNPLFDSEEKGGILRELINELTEKGAWGGFRGKSIHFEAMKHLLEQKITEAGVEVLYETRFSRALCEDKTVTGVICENIAGRFALMGKEIVDCTGDGNVCASAGCPFWLGEDGDIDSLQAMTLMFTVANIPEKYRIREGLMIGHILDAAYEAVGKVSPFHLPVLIPAPGNAYANIQFTHVYGVDPLDPKQRTEAVMELRHQMIEAMDLLKAYDSDFADMEIVASAPMLGVRESRRIIGEYTLTADDALEGRTFPDGVCTVRFNIDIHSKSSGNRQDLKKVQPYQIPLRAMLPKGYKGLSVAGRCISGTHTVMASYRVTGDCFAMGEGLGKYLAEKTAK